MRPKNQFDGDYGAFHITLALMSMILLGGTRLRYLRVLERDPLFLQFAQLQRPPTDRMVSKDIGRKSCVPHRPISRPSVN